MSKKNNKPSAIKNGNNSNNDKIVLSKKKIKAFVVGIFTMIGISLPAAAFLGAKKTEANLQPYSVKDVVEDYADKLLARKNILTLAKRIFINEYNRFYGTNLNENNVTMQIKHGNVNGFKIVYFEGFNAIQDANKGSGSYIKCTVSDENGTIQRVFYGSRDEKGKPTLTLDTDELVGVLNGEIKPDDFEAKTIKELYDMMANAITATEPKNEKKFTKEFREDLIKYLIKYIKEIQYDEWVRDNFGEVLNDALIPTEENESQDGSEFESVSTKELLSDFSDEKDSVSAKEEFRNNLGVNTIEGSKVEVTLEDMTYYCTTNALPVPDKLFSLKSRYSTGDISEEDMMNELRELIYSDDECAELYNSVIQGKENATKVSDFVSLPIEEILDIFKGDSK